jgi:hypothetical protein
MNHPNPAPFEAAGTCFTDEMPSETRSGSSSMKTASRSVAYPVHLRSVAASVALPPPRPGRCTFFVRFLGEFIAPLAVAGACALPACNAARSPTASQEGDGGELSCADRLRARSICQTAMQQRCESQGNDCESSCDVQGNLPGNNEKTPSSRSDMETTQCRANCRQVRDACVRTVATRCPAPCE